MVVNQAEQIPECTVAPTHPDAPQAFRWRLDGPNLPRITTALRIGEATRDAIYKSCAEVGLWPLPQVFHRSRSEFHEHAYWLPEDADSDGLIDHVLPFAESGLPDEIIPVLAAGCMIWAWPGTEWRLLPDWMGRRVPGALFGPIDAWSTATAYIPPRWLRRHNRPNASDLPADHLAFEAQHRGLPPPVRIDISSRVLCGSRSIRADAFNRGTKKRLAPTTFRTAGVTLRFTKPVWGPLAFGFGAHFGLGLFEPAPGALGEGT